MKTRICLAATASILFIFSAPIFGEEEQQFSVISIDAFTDGVKHYQSGRGSDDYDRYTPEQIVEIGRNILLHQRTNGGWACNWDPLRVLSESEMAAIISEKSREDTSFDNRATYPQTEYLAHVYQQSGGEAFRDGALAGLAFILAAQYDSGGWSHSYPASDNYRQHITFMDDVMVGILSFLRKTTADTATYAFIPDDMRERIAEAVRRGDELILRLQIVANGTRTAWAGQYDRLTLEPAQARAYELPSIVSAESVGVTRYLMRMEPPTTEVMNAVMAAAAWFESAKIHGIRVETVEIEPIRYEHHTATTDRRVVEDSTAPPIWARFYEIDTNRPFMANRDGVKVYSLAEVAHERRTGYGWYTYGPASLLEKDYPAWLQKWETILPVNMSN